MKRLLLTLASLLLSTSLYAVEIADVSVPEEVQPDGSTETLTLNGAGIRSKFFFNIYVAALYLPSPTPESKTIIATDQPNRVLMHFLYSEVAREKLIDGWIDGFNNNTSKEAMSELENRLAKFNTLFETVVEGDQILLDYRPTRGTQVTIRGEIKGTVPGHDFNQALLRVWLGPEPVTSDLKEALLGAE
jgi:hypothetical protein